MIPFRSPRTGTESAECRTGSAWLSWRGWVFTGRATDIRYGLFTHVAPIVTQWRFFSLFMSVPTKWNEGRVCVDLKKWLDLVQVGLGQWFVYGNDRIE